MMKVSALVLALALAGTSTSDAFVSKATAPVSRTSAIIFETSIGPITGGVGGSTLLPTKYDKVSIDNPWGTGSEKPYALTRIVESSDDGTTAFSSNTDGPVTGGVYGSTMCPKEYEKVSVDNPWGDKNPAHPTAFYYPQAVPGFGGQARLPVGKELTSDTGSQPTVAQLPALSGMTGGVEGAAFLPQGYGTVDIDAPWGRARKAPLLGASAASANSVPAIASAPVAVAAPLPAAPVAMAAPARVAVPAPVVAAPVAAAVAAPVEAPAPAAPAPVEAPTPPPVTPAAPAAPPATPEA